MPGTYALVPAAGAGRRMGGAKQFMSLAGRPLLLHALTTLTACQGIDGMVVMVPGADVDRTISLLADFPGTRVVAGGETRQESVWLGLAALPAGVEWVVVHDAARPLLKEQDLRAVIDAARCCGAATLAVPVKDTVKTAGPDGMVGETLPRDKLWLTQTPQVFRYDWFAAAHSRARREGITANDDATLLEMKGHPVKLVSGSYDNIKVTTPEDLLVAGVLMEG